MSKRLYIGNLAYDATEADVRAAFEYGGRNVTDVHIPTDRETGEPRGFAFVEMGSAAEAQEVIEDMNGADLNGRALRVNVAKPRQNSGGGGRQRSPSGGGSQSGGHDRW